MDEELTEEQTYKTSKYNSAQLINIEIHETWKKAKGFAILGMYHSWNVILDMVWADLAADLDETAEENMKYNEFTKRLAETGTLEAPKILAFNAEKANMNKTARQFSILLEKHIWLKRLQNKLGKGTAYRDEFEDDIE